MKTTLILIALLSSARLPAQTMNMQEITRALGVQCRYCHSAARGSGQPEPKKEIARAMMSMTADLNAKIELATGKSPVEAARVECGTCHHGVAIPRLLPDLITRTVNEKGGAAAADQYRELRKQFYGGNVYDFTEATLLETANRIANSHPRDAIILLRMNLEFNPQSAWTYALIGIACTRAGDEDSAIMNLEKSLELDAANGEVRGRLEQLREYRRRRQHQ
jgi:tetratricopeptide (TPR) repeat protein